MGYNTIHNSRKTNKQVNKQGNKYKPLGTNFNKKQMTSEIKKNQHNEERE